MRSGPLRDTDFLYFRQDARRTCQHEATRISFPCNECCGCPLKDLGVTSDLSKKADCALHAVVIGWDGMHAAAAGIAAELHSDVARLDVIYSNLAETSETGHGKWHQVPQSWFFGWKFRKALDLFLSEPATTHLLIISADAKHDCWPALARRGSSVLGADHKIGVWAPDLNETPWPTDLVAVSPPHRDGLVEVLQTDGVVWALSGPLAEALSALSFAENNLGWGIDWVAIRIAQAKGLRVCRDLTCAIHHPQTRGYSSSAAERQMWAFLGQLPRDDQNWIRQIRARLQGQGATPYLRTELSGLENSMKFTSDSTRATKITEIQYHDGIVLIGTNAPIEGLDIHVSAGGEEIAFDRVEDPVFAGAVARLIHFDLTPSETDVEKSVNGHGDWQVAMWDTLRVALVSQAVKETMSMPLTTPVALGECPYPQRFTAFLAVHRARGTLVLRIRTEDAQDLHRIDVPFAAQFKGGATPEGYQRVEVAIPAIPSGSVLQIDLEYHSTNPIDPALPEVFFIADPRIEPDRNPGSTISQVIARRLEPFPAKYWYRANASTRMLGAEAPIRLCQTGSPDHALVPPHPAKIHLIKDYGYAIELNSTADASCVLWVNGAPGFP